MGKNFKDELSSIPDHLDSSCQKAAKEDLQILLDNGIENANDLIELLKNKQAKKDLRLTACWAIGCLGKKNAVDALMTGFKDDDMHLTWEAAKSLGSISSKKSVMPLIKIMLASSDTGKRTAAAYALGIIKDERAIEPLIDIISNLREDADLRAHAAESLGYFGDNRAADPLIRGLKDNSAEVRYWSAFALGLLGDQAALPELGRVAKTDEAVIAGHGSVRDEAKHAIEDILSKEKELGSKTGAVDP